MAMAELVIHDTEDPRMQYPRAPPPSPEAQQRSLGSIFEIPASAFGPLDLRQQDFAVALDFILTQTDTSRANSNSSPLSTVPERGSPCANYLTEDEDDYIGFPGSPKKRVCNSPCSFPEGYEPQLSTDTHSQSTRHRRSPVHSNSLPSSRNSNSPPYVQQRSPHSLQQTGPYFIPQKLCETMNGFGSGRHTPNNTPVHSYNPALSPPSHVGMLSKSFDLHSMNPFHIDTDLPEPRTRSYTLGAPKLEDDMSHRKRKISLKRTKDERDSELQFSFEYSYASTGSSEESDWLVVDRDTTTTLPLGKKACQDPQSNSQVHVPTHLPLTFAHTDPNHIQSSLEQLKYTYPAEPRTDLSSLAQNLNSDYSNSVFNSSNQGVPAVRPASINAGASTDHQPPSLTSVDSVQMMDVCDTSLRLDSLDSMECGPSEQLPSMDMQTSNCPSIRLPLEQAPQIGRSHSSGATRHSFFENMFSFSVNSSNAAGPCDGKGSGIENTTCTTQDFNFSKSL